MSSLSGALNTAVAALKAQSSATATISNNIANADTVAYKSSGTSFYTLVTSTNSSESIGNEGVTAEPNQDLLDQGDIVETSSATDLAIDGDGFFIVSSTEDGSEVYYTRSGDFSTDEDGNLVNESGYYLMGYPTDQDGNVLVSSSSLSTLEVINVSALGATASASTEVEIEGNLPANADTSDTFETTIEIYDSLGTASTLTLTWTKTGENTWTATCSDPYSSDDTSTSLGTASLSMTVTFNSDGSIASITGNTLTVTGWTDGASDSTITLDIGTVGESDGLTQLSTDSDDIDIEDYTATTDGVAYGEFTDIEIDEDGVVWANFDNGVSYAIYQIALATFANADGLAAVSGNAYKVTNSSGSPEISLPGSGAAGIIYSYSLEESNVDTAEELVNLIEAQQAYSAASQVVTTVDDMYDTLIRSMA